MGDGFLARSILLQVVVFCSIRYIATYGIVHFIPALSALTQPSTSAYNGLGNFIMTMTVAF